MNKIHVHPDDWKRFRRWLRSNLSFFTVAVVLVIAVRFQPEMPTSPRLSAFEGSGSSTHQSATETPLGLGSADASAARPVAPEGWRRTRDGWEHVSTWTSLKSINQLIAEQHDLEPAWARSFFSQLRSISPLMLALLQITAIAAIVNVARSRESDSPLAQKNTAS